MRNPLLTVAKALILVLAAWVGVLFLSACLLPFSQVDALLTIEELKDPERVKLASRLLKASHWRYLPHFAGIGALALVALLLLVRQQRRAGSAPPPG